VLINEIRVIFICGNLRSIILMCLLILILLRVLVVLCAFLLARKGAKMQSVFSAKPCVIIYLFYIFFVLISEIRAIFICENLLNQRHLRSII